MTPTLLWREKLPAGGVFTNGAPAILVLHKPAIGPSALQRNTDHRFLSLSPAFFRKSNPTVKYPGYIFAAMLAIAVGVGFPFYFQGAPLLAAALIGAVCGVFGIWFVAYWTHQIRKHITPAFAIGDLVVVKDGPHTGTTGRVTELGGRGSKSVVVTLQDGLATIPFDSSLIRKL